MTETAMKKQLSEELAVAKQTIMLQEASMAKARQHYRCGSITRFATELALPPRCVAFGLYRSMLSHPHWKAGPSLRYDAITTTEGVVLVPTLFSWS